MRSSTLLLLCNLNLETTCARWLWSLLNLVLKIISWKLWDDFTSTKFSFAGITMSAPATLLYWYYCRRKLPLAQIQSLACGLVSASLWLFSGSLGMQRITALLSDPSVICPYFFDGYSQKCLCRACRRWGWVVLGPSRPSSTPILMHPNARANAPTCSILHALWETTHPGFPYALLKKQ